MRLQLLRLTLLSSLVSLIACAPFKERDILKLDPDKVVGFPETVPNTTIGRLMLSHKPYLAIHNGCMSFPAVDKDGNAGAGLDTKGSQSDGCEKSEGQVYGRAVEHEGLLALMYAWYMPKDEASPGMGHRHDFEHVIVWLSNVTESSEIVGVVISAHGGYQTSTGADLQVLEGRPTIGYVSYWPFNHQLIPTFAVGEEQPLIAWESMTDEARATINYHDFGSALPAFKESRFKGYVKRAYSLIFDSQAVLEAQETTESAAGSTTSPVPSEPSSSQTSTRTKHRRKR